MEIATIGTGNVGGALAAAFTKAGHTINLGVRSKKDFKGQWLLRNPEITVSSIKEAVTKSEVIVLATPAIHSIF